MGPRGVVLLGGGVAGGGVLGGVACGGDIAGGEGVLGGIIMEESLASSSESISQQERSGLLRDDSS